MNTDEDLPPKDPADALRLIDEQRTTAARRLEPNPLVYYVPWGSAWLIGFGLLFLRFPPTDEPLVDMPGWLPLATLFTLLGTAGVITAVAGIRSQGHVAGSSARRGAWYGWSWPLAFLTLFAAASQVSDTLPPDLTGLLWSALSVGISGILLMAGGAVFLDRGLFLLGVAVIVVNLVGTFAGPGWHSLVVAVAGGGGMLLTGLVTWPRCRPRSQGRGRR
ncbi:transporter [Micromonospora sp. SH-82]|uniref:transporter n=1 Tax=Micromonospora sp. SH-82 TaxID=3132938 RepID=UPI003EBB4585